MQVVPDDAETSPCVGCCCVADDHPTSCWLLHVTHGRVPFRWAGAVAPVAHMNACKIGRHTSAPSGSVWPLIRCLCYVASWLAAPCTAAATWSCWLP